MQNHDYQKCHFRILRDIFGELCIKQKFFRIKNMQETIKPFWSILCTSFTIFPTLLISQFWSLWSSQIFLMVPIFETSKHVDWLSMNGASTYWHDSLNFNVLRSEFQKNPYFLSINGQFRDLVPFTFSSKQLDGLSSNIREIFFIIPGFN